MNRVKARYFSVWNSNICLSATVSPQVQEDSRLAAPGWLRVKTGSGSKYVPKIGTLVNGNMDQNPVVLWWFNFDQNQWYHFGVGEFTPHFRTYFSGDWDVHWRYGVLTHSRVSQWEAAKMLVLPLVSLSSQKGDPPKTNKKREGENNKHPRPPAA